MAYPVKAVDPKKFDVTQDSVAYPSGTVVRYP